MDMWPIVPKIELTIVYVRLAQTGLIFCDDIITF